MSMQGAQGMQNAQYAQGWAGVASGVANSIAGMRQASAARKAYKQQAKAAQALAENEAEAILQGGDERFMAFSQRVDQTRLDAARILQAGEDRAAEIRHDGTALVSSIRANAAAHGIRRTGSPMEVAAEAVYVMEQQASQVERDTAMAAQNKLFEARQLQMAGLQDLRATARQAQTTILTGGAQASMLRSKAPGRFETFGKALAPLGELNPEKAAFLAQGAKSIWSQIRGPKAPPVSPGNYSSPRGSEL